MHSPRSLGRIRRNLPSLLKRIAPHRAHFLLQPLSRGRPVGSLHLPHIPLQLRVPSILCALEQAQAHFAVYGRRLRGLGLDDAVQKDCLLVQQGALVEAIARMEVQGEVDDGRCESEAAELL